MDVTRDQVRDYLLDKHCSLWADFEIVKKDRMELAIDWFLKEINGLEEFIKPEEYPMHCIAQGLFEYRGWEFYFSGNRWVATSPTQKYALTTMGGHDDMKMIIDKEISSRTT